MSTRDYHSTNLPAFYSKAQHLSKAPEVVYHIYNAYGPGKTCVVFAGSCLHTLNVSLQGGSKLHGGGGQKPRKVSGYM